MVNISLITEPTREAIEAISDLYDVALEKTVSEFLQMGPGSRQSWKVVPASFLSKIHQESLRPEGIRSTKVLERIADQITQNIIRIAVNTDIAGHSSKDPEVLDPRLTAEAQERLPEWLEDENGNRRISDGVDTKLIPLATKLLSASDSMEKFTIINVILNVIHQRSDMAANFVEGGSKTLDILSGVGQETNVIPDLPSP